MKKKEISEIVEMGVKAKLIFSAEDRTTPWDERADLTKHLVRFAKLVAAKEREACAEIAEKQRYAMFISLTSHPAQNGTAVGIANAIRARGEA